MKQYPIFKPFIKKDIVLQEIEKVLDSGWISGGPAIAQFERSMQDYNNDPTSNYISVSNATVGLEMALQCVNNGKLYNHTDEIIVPSWSWVATGFVVVRMGATPKWADVDYTGCINAETIEPLITDNTKAIIAVHQMGVPCDMDSINELAKKYKLPVIEDAACAFGTEYKGVKIGNSDNIVVFSHQAKKTLITGEGGTITTKNPEYAEWLRSYRIFGSNASPLKRSESKEFIKEQFDILGTNNKISDINCAVGIAHLKYIDEEIELRNKARLYYDEIIQSMQFDGYGVQRALHIPDYCTRFNAQNYHILLSHFIDRDEVIIKMKEFGINCKWDIQAIHLEPCMNWTNWKVDLPQTMYFHGSGLILPFYAGLTNDDIDFITGKLKEVILGIQDRIIENGHK